MTETVLLRFCAQGLVATTEVFHSGSGGGGRGLAEAMRVPFLGQVCILKLYVSVPRGVTQQTPTFSSRFCLSQQNRLFDRRLRLECYDCCGCCSRPCLAEGTVNFETA